MKIDVKKNAKRNIIFGLANKIVLLFFPFFIKAFINTYLGSEYLGLNSLFTSILSVLSLTELGISSALVYANLVVKGIVCLIIPTLLYFLVYGRTNICKNAIQMIKGTRRF